MLLRVAVFVRMRMRVLAGDLMSMCVRMLMVMRMRMAVRMRIALAVGVFVGMIVSVFRSVRVSVMMGIFARHHIDLGSGDSAAAHFAHLEARAYIQRRSRLSQSFKGNACIDKRAEQHVAADAGEALQISNSHAS